MTHSPGSPALDSPCPPARLSRDERLQLVRRLDWRFLLPETALGRVAIAGRGTEELARALGAFAASVTSFGDSTTGQRVADLPPFDGVVLRGVPLAEAPAALRLLCPGGWLYWEFAAWQEVPSRVRRQLAAAGFEAVALQWHRPDFTRCMDIVPLGERALVNAILSRDTERPAKRAAAAAARLLQRAGMLERWLPAWSAVALAPAAKTASATDPATAGDARHPAPADHLPMLHALFLAEPAAARLRPELPSGALTIAYRTPRFRASGHVLGFVHARGESAPRWVAKMARLPEDRAALEAEAANLAAAHAPGDVPGAAIPRCIACRAWRGSHVLLETAVPGSPLKPARLRRDTARWCEAVTRWLGAFHGATRREVLGPEGVNQNVHAPLAALHAAGGQLAALAVRTTALLPAELTQLPAVLEHGDLAAPNVLGTLRGEVSVVDWELADAAGLPATDLFFFLNYAAGARDGGTTGVEILRAYHAALLAPDAWARRWVTAYAGALQIPAALLPALLLVTWPRVVARLLARLQAGDGIGAEVERYVALWRHTLEHLQEVRFSS
jgi:Ser/Thr protein kinase RdoA (MazF antagonist)